MYTQTSRLSMPWKKHPLQYCTGKNCRRAAGSPMARLRVTLAVLALAAVHVPGLALGYKPRRLSTYADTRSRAAGAVHADGEPELPTSKLLPADPRQWASSSSKAHHAPHAPHPSCCPGNTPPWDAEGRVATVTEFDYGRTGNAIQVSMHVLDVGLKHGCVVVLPEAIPVDKEGTLPKGDCNCFDLRREFDKGRSERCKAKDAFRWRGELEEGTGKYGFESIRQPTQMESDEPTKLAELINAYLGVRPGHASGRRARAWRGSRTTRAPL